MPDRHIEAKVIAVVQRTFQAEDQAITSETEAGDVPGWDSVAHSNLIMDIEDELGVSLDLNEVYDYQTVGDIVEGVRKAGGDKP